METRLAKRKKMAVAALEEAERSTIKQNDSVVALFGNDVVFGLIGDYLEIPDLKILRQTCKLLLTKVNHHRKFIPNLTTTVTNEAVQETAMSPQHSLGWRSVKIFMEHLAPQHFANIPIHSLQDLKLHRSVRSDHIPPRPKELAAQLSACCKWLKSSDMNLMSLTLDVNLLLYSFPKSTLGTLEKLKELCFVGDVVMFGRTLTTNERRNLRNNVTRLGNVKWQLRSIAVNTSMAIHGSEACAKMLTSSAQILQSILMKYPVNVVIFGDNLFPELRNLQLLVKEHEANLAATFLNGLPKLESMDLRIHGEVTAELLEAVRRLCSPIMHTCIFHGLDKLISFPDANSWRFISCLTGLKTFEFLAFGSEDYVGSGILGFLPSSIESIKMIDHTTIENDAVQITRAALLSYLTGFLHLTTLQIKSSVFDDQTLQSICGALINLRTFQFSLWRITDFGLTGRRIEAAGILDTGISLRNLKGLRELRMDYRTENVTELGLLYALCFVELKSLTVSHFFLTDRNILIIAARNPSLEIFTRYVNRRREDFGERVLFSRLLKINPRLTRIFTTYDGETTTEYSGDYEVSPRPSYGVAARFLSDLEIAQIRSSLKMALNVRDDILPTSFYYFDL